MISLLLQRIGTRNVLVVLCGILLFGITSATMFSSAAPSSQRDRQWVDVGETGDGKAILQVDKKSIHLINTDTLEKSLVGGQFRFVPKKTPIDPKDKETLSAINIAVTNAQACKNGQGKLFIGPADKVSDAVHQQWNKDSRTMLDIIGISLCTMALEQVREQNEQNDPKQFLKNI